MYPHKLYPRLTDIAVAAITKKLQDLRLKIVAQIDEALWFHVLPRTRCPPATCLAVQSERNRVKDGLKHLGVKLEGPLRFDAHFIHLSPKVDGIGVLLGRLLPNFKVRRLYSGVIYSLILVRKYGIVILQITERES